ncbi:hypothetical protein A3H65_00595 [Candidatus Giovannonibacteria bacterium RIFCSPLOWO2_02_FULL_45_14]|uniref:Response regulatory domain-containing protein n=1 Tax=Candidatus Giovannonibacteria bacterium RIFCSPLOWO2_12_FULL_44_15 TaxID=1798364 RepID=A0A1F5Y1I9_9BACT|nr:MAG: hypothetical protein A3C75_02880 [Candidatus Giovannonibacteria bacterium RIFCSPHIGHO2_02_FULL_44_31]OGF90964.1 MAG: hypothetical protein A3H65_00595 [Candidatus Giovannonibacteria bacterium RIFCSPLOWO2_02_FULL_45_14]OGF93711.1 MAG: hypothetical protein A3G54_02085 [Candidatus Giovannonibacteria bacterium RIFCSPLOWO2_12_FULL_44_15]
MYKNLLIIEDEMPLLKIMMEEFSNSNIKVMGASNGKEGLKFALDKHPDLIVLDLLMPKMDGIAMLKKLREDEWGKNASVIILTNLEGRSDATLAALDSGVFEFLVKTRISLEGLKEKIMEKLEKK